MSQTSSITPRERVKTALRHEQPDRVPVDFLATPEIWRRLVAYLGLNRADAVASGHFDPLWEAVLHCLAVDCRVLSYDQFCAPPASVFKPGARVEWWDALSRSTPNRMWRQITPAGDIYDIWGHHIRVVEMPTGAYEEFAGWPLGDAQSVEDLRRFPWPEPDWWDFDALPAVIAQMDARQEHHIRFRVGSVFEVAWQLRGMQTFLMDLAVSPEIPRYIMDRLTEVYVENTRRVLALAGDRIDMIYFYDDVATQDALMISSGMWEQFVKPQHARIIEVARQYDRPVMYHCDGAIYHLIPQLIDMGVTLLNPIQADARGMDPQKLKAEFGSRLSFHGGIDIIKTLPRGTVEDVHNEVRERVRVLGKGGGYILASSHHIQSDTPIENVLAMYDVALRAYPS